MSVNVPRHLSTDALVKRITLCALIGLLLALILSALVSAIVAVALFYALLVASNTAG